MKTLAAIMATIGGLLIWSVAAEAAVYKRDAHTLEISGPTTRQQAAQAITLLRANDIKRVVMWGDGGDFYAGLAIGLEIQREGVTVQVPTGRRCVSACAFAAIAADNIMLGGELWFHAAYIPHYPTNVTLEKISLWGQQTGAQTLYYATKIDVPAVFIWEILTTTSPCKFLVVKSTRSIRSVVDKGFHDKIAYSRKSHNECYAQNR